MIHYIPSGDSAFLLKFGDSISEDINHQIRNFTNLVRKANLKGIIELVPSYCDLLIYYNPLTINHIKLLAKLRKIESKIDSTKRFSSKTIRIPVLYSHEFGKDLEKVAKHTQLTIPEIVRLHTERKYLVYMLGFTPGFCYLGGMNPKLATPRKSEPELKILSGSVGIADNQTGIYPIESPGGWQIIGRTPVKLFNPEKNHPFLCEAGDYLEFYSISETEYYEYNQNN